MAILLIGGVDYTNNVSQSVFTLGSGALIGSSYARTGINGLNFPNSSNAYAGVPFTRTTVAVGTQGIMMGAAIKPDALNGSGASFTSLISMQYNGAETATLYGNGLGQLMVGNSGVQGLTSAGRSVPAQSVASYLVQNQWHYYEVYFFGPENALNVYAFIDGILVVGCLLTNRANNVSNQAVFGKFYGSSAFGYSMADIYVMDNQGPNPWNGGNEGDLYIVNGVIQAPLGNCAVFTQMPAAPGSFSQWTPNPGTNANWQNVDSIPAGSNYNAAAATGLRDSFDIHSFAVTGNAIIAAMALVYGVSGGSVQLIPRQAGTDKTTASPITMTLTFAYGYSIFETDVSNNQWNFSNLNATEFGYERIS